MCVCVSIALSQLVNNPGHGSMEETPLSLACARGFLDIVKLLVERADLSYRCSVRKDVQQTITTQMYFVLFFLVSGHFLSTGFCSLD